MKKLIALFLAALLALSLAACGQAQQPESGKTLVYGSGDYTAINPALYEHGEINLSLPG